MKAILQKINQIRMHIDKNVSPITEDDLIKFIESIPVKFRNNRKWMNNLIFREFFNQHNPYDSESFTTKKFKNLMLDECNNIAEIGTFHLKEECRIYGRLTMLKFIKYLLWYHCYGYIDHRLSIHRNGDMAFIDKYHPEKGFVRFRNFAEYNDLKLAYA